MAFRCKSPGQLPEAPIVPDTETTLLLNSIIFENLVCIYCVQIEIAAILH